MYGLRPIPSRKPQAFQVCHPVRRRLLTLEHHLWQVRIQYIPWNVCSTSMLLATWLLADLLAAEIALRSCLTLTSSNLLSCCLTCLSARVTRCERLGRTGGCRRQRVRLWMRRCGRSRRLGRLAAWWRAPRVRLRMRRAGAAGGSWRPPPLDPKAIQQRLLYSQCLRLRARRGSTRFEAALGENVGFRWLWVRFLETVSDLVPPNVLEISRKAVAPYFL